jgi:polysaccharide export outer membrane protein
MQLKAWIRRALVASIVIGSMIALTSFVVQASTPGQGELYAIGPDDVLSINIWNERDVSGKFNVEADGSLTFPLIGRVEAAGRTVRDLEGELRKRLSAGYITNPQVSVTVETYGSQRIFLVGEVRQPGMYPLRGKMSLMEALARAGSTTQMAGGEAFVVRRTDRSASGAVLPEQASEPSDVTRVDLTELHRGRLDQNISLSDGDTVFVPRAETMYVSGYVRNPGAYPIQKGTTALQAVTLAGGVTDRGSTTRLKVIRMVDGQRTESRLNENDAVQPGDTIVVLQRLF